MGFSKKQRGRRLREKWVRRWRGGGGPGVGRGRVVGGLMAAGGGVECLCTVYFISVMDSFNLSDERSRNNETASALSAADTNPNAPSLC